MKKLLLASLVAAVSVLFFACQKEVSFELGGTPAQGSLQEDGGGLCLPKTVNGTYIAGTALNPSTNTINVEVDVLQTGSYTIHSDTINGYHFSASGNFTATGPQALTLRGSGTPLVQGNNVFTIFFDSTACDITVQVLPAGAGGPAAFTLAGAGGNCTSFTPAGNYIIGTPLNSNNTVTLSVNVTTIGTYNVSTTAVNGMTFSGNGVLTTTGPNTIVLTGSGTPTGTPGSVSIPVTAGTSTCNFQITTVSGGTFTVDCSSAFVDGIYQAGSPLGATHTVDIDVNVSAVGPYNIATTLNNGMTFSASGVFASTGVTTIQLVGSGTPTAAGTFNIQVPGSPSCTFPVTVTGAATIDWSFKIGTTTYQGSTALDGVDYDASTAPFTLLDYFGENVAGDDFSFSLIDLAGGILANETYSSATLTSNVAAFYFFDGAGTLDLQADPTITGTSMIFKITSHTTATKTVIGTFSGNAYDAVSNSMKAITAGTFKAVYP